MISQGLMSTQGWVELRRNKDNHDSSRWTRSSVEVPPLAGQTSHIPPVTMIAKAQPVQAQQLFPRAITMSMYDAGQKEHKEERQDYRQGLGSGLDRSRIIRIKIFTINTQASGKLPTATAPSQTTKPQALHRQQTAELDAI